MNIFKKTCEDLLADDALPVEPFDTLPGVPDNLSLKDTAHVLCVSVQTVKRMVEAGDLPLSPEGYVLKSKLKEYISCHALADLPVFEA